MFKKYVFKWTGADENVHSVDFYVNRKKTKNGFMHRACMIGEPPRIDQTESDFSKYKANNDKLFKSRVHKVSFCNRTWESWSGQTCLAGLWDKIAKLKFVDLSEISSENPFKGEQEPECTDIQEADELFDGFERKFYV